MERRAYLRSLTAGSLTAGLVGASGCLGTVVGDSDATTTVETTEEPQFRIETVTMELEVPWGAAFGPDRDLYVTERPGRVQRVAYENGQQELVADFTDRVAARGEGGLLGLAFHPDDSDVAYTYQTYDAEDGLANRVVRHRVSEGFAPDGTILDAIPASSVHDGGRIAFGPEGALYVTTGDASQRSLAQDPESLAGKVLRVTPDGDPHPDNPFDNPVFTYGHRNPQGLAWRAGTDDAADRPLLATEHGPSTDDEINVLRAGNNYGWPKVTGSTDGGRFTDPVAAYTPTIAPASAAFYYGPIADWAGDFFFGTLAGTHLHRVRFDDDEVVEQQRLLDGKYGRLRTVFTGPDDHLYVTTSNRDGRGTPAPQDDRVLRIQPP